MATVTRGASRVSSARFRSTTSLCPSCDATSGSSGWEERKETPTATCEVCGNDYDKAFEVVRDGERHVFDSFECAIHALAPKCEHCGCRIIGHGVESDGRMFCCAHCAEQEGVSGLRDRA